MFMGKKKKKKSGLKRFPDQFQSFNLARIQLYKVRSHHVFNCSKAAFSLKQNIQMCIISITEVDHFDQEEPIQTE